MVERGKWQVYAEGVGESEITGFLVAGIEEPVSPHGILKPLNQESDALGHEEATESVSPDTEEMEEKEENKDLPMVDEFPIEKSAKLPEKWRYTEQMIPSALGVHTGAPVAIESFSIDDVTLPSVEMYSMTDADQDERTIAEFIKCRSKPQTIKRH